MPMEWKYQLEAEENYLDRLLEQGGIRAFVKAVNDGVLVRTDETHQSCKELAEAVKTFRSLTAKALDIERQKNAERLVDSVKWGSEIERVNQALQEAGTSGELGVRRDGTRQSH